MYLSSKPCTVYSTQANKNYFIAHCALHVVHSQRGWLMPVAAFIVVVMGFLAAGMGYVSSQASIAATQEQISVQSFYASESGAQYGMNRLFYDASGTISRASATTACNTINGDTLSFATAGMQNCEATISCTVNSDGADTTSFFAIGSAASCGIAPVTAERTVDVSAFLQ